MVIIDAVFIILGFFLTCIAELLEAVEMTFLDTDAPGTAPCDCNDNVYIAYNQLPNLKKSSKLMLYSLF